MRRLRSPILASIVLLAAACGRGDTTPAASATRDTLVVYEAASLAGAMRAALDSFSRRTGTVVQEEHGASLELARRITELHRVPDVIALADEEVFPQILEPAHAGWHAAFARNRMVVAFTDRSRGAREMTPGSWYRVLLRPDVLVGRTDAELAPAGYRALLMYALAESLYHEPGLAARLAARTPQRLLRGNAADLAALLEAGELDYIVDYESLARSHNFRWVALPPAIDLGDASHAADYARATVRVKRGRDSVTVTGAPIRYALAIPREAPHAGVALRFVSYLLGPEGRQILRRNSVDALPRAELHGDSIPAVLQAPAP